VEVLAVHEANADEDIAMLVAMGNPVQLLAVDFLVALAESLVVLPYSLVDFPALLRWNRPAWRAADPFRLFRFFRPWVYLLPSHPKKDLSNKARTKIARATTTTQGHCRFSRLIVGQLVGGWPNGRRQR